MEITTIYIYLYIFLVKIVFGKGYHDCLVTLKRQVHFNATTIETMCTYLLDIFNIVNNNVNYI